MSDTNNKIELKAELKGMPEMEIALKNAQEAFDKLKEAVRMINEIQLEVEINATP